MFKREYSKGQKVLGRVKHSAPQWRPAVITDWLRVYGFSEDDDRYEYVARFADGREYQLKAIDLKPLKGGRDA